MEHLFRKECENIAIFRRIVETVLEDLFTMKNLQDSIRGEMSTTDYKALISELKIMLKTLDFNTSSIREKLLNYDPEKVNCFIEALNEKRNKLMLKSICEHNSAYGDTATDFDWKLKLVLGTSTYNELQYSVFELDVQTLNSDKKFEFTKIELEKLISALEGSL